MAVTEVQDERQEFREWMNKGLNENHKLLNEELTTEPLSQTRQS